MLDGLRDLFLSALRGEEKADVLVRKWNIEVKAIQEIYDKARDGERISAEPKIIRCKDCKWFNDIGCSIRIVDDSDKPTENDFCSFAERRQM